MDLGLTGKVALVTGSSRGIGRGIAEMLAQEGCDLVLTGTSEQALGEAAAAVGAHGHRIETLALDLRQEEAPAALAAAVRRAWGRLDILVNNAGTTKRGDFLKLTDADWADGYALKFFAHVRLARAAWPMLKESGGSLLALSRPGRGVPPAGVFPRALCDISPPPPNPRLSALLGNSP